MSEETPQLPTNAEDLKPRKRRSKMESTLSAMESTSTVVGDDSAASAPTNTTSDPSALGEALGSISAAPAPTPPKPTNVAVKVRQEDVALVVSPIPFSSCPLCLVWVVVVAGDGKDLLYVRNPSTLKADMYLLREKMEQFELSKPKATDALRKNGGDVVATLRALVTA